MYLMRMSTPKEAVLLLEEPELHTHPSLLRLTSNAIIKTYSERSNQVFVSTHSLEFIEPIIEEARKSGLRENDLRIYRLILREGKLNFEYYTLSEAEEAVKKLEWDLRS